MAQSVEIKAPERDDQLDQFADIMAMAFCGDAMHMRAVLERVGRENVRCAVSGRAVQAGLIVLRVGQWFGGRSVPTAGIAVVATAPPFRGTGVAGKLMRSVLAEMREAGIPLSTLYPASIALYRKFGYELAGTRFAVRLNPARIDVMDRGCTVRPFREADQPGVEDVNRRWAASHDGNIDRDAYFWHRVFHPRGQDTRGFIIEADGCPEGYVFYQQTRVADQHRQDLAITDMAVTTPRAVRRLLTFLADHRSMVKHVTWFSGPADPMLALLSEQAYEQRLDVNWMVRVLDARAALAARGYPQGAAAELHLEIDDAMFAANSGRFVLTVADGQGHMAAGGEGRIKLSERALACLFTGYRSLRELNDIGWTHAAESDIALASSVFSGPMPWMRDQF